MVVVVKCLVAMVWRSEQKIIKYSSRRHTIGPNDTRMHHLGHLQGGAGSSGGHGQVSGDDVLALEKATFFP